MKKTADLLLTDGRFTMGLNYWCSVSGTEMWSLWNEDSIREDFKILSTYGIDCLRVFPRWDQFQPITMISRGDFSGGQKEEIRMGEVPLPDTEAGHAGVDESMMQRFCRFADLAHEYGIHLIPAILTGFMTGRLFLPSALEKLDAFSDPVSLLWQMKFIRYFVSVLKKHPAITAWESGNESCSLSHSTPDRMAFWNLMIYNTIRSEDDTHPVIGFTHGTFREKEWMKCLIQDQRESCDILSTHYYSILQSRRIRDGYRAPRNLLSVAAENRFCADLSEKPSFVAECGLWRSTCIGKEALGHAVRSILWDLWTEDIRSLFWWCAFDQTNLNFAPYDWDYAGLEHGFFTEKREAHPSANEFRSFSIFLNSLPFHLPPVTRHAVCVCCDNEIAESTFILAKRAGLHLEFQSPDRPLKDASCYLLPSIFRKNWFPVDFWNKLKQRVFDGATLYLSLNETTLPCIEELFQIEIIRRLEKTENRSYCFRSGYTFNLPGTTRLETVSRGAEVIGCEKNTENPVFFRTLYGQGTLFLLTFPLEKCLMETNGAYESNLWKIYQDVCPVKHLLTEDSERLFVSEHFFNSGKAACILINHSEDTIHSKAIIADGWNITSFHSYAGSTFHEKQLDIPPNNGIVFIIEKIS